MMYSLWSHGELLGESTLDYVRVINTLRTGDLQLTPKGLTVIGRLTQTRDDSYRGARRVIAERSDSGDESSEPTLRADLSALHDQYDALALELRAPNGEVIPTDDIHVTDTEWLLAIDRERHGEEESSTEDAMDGGQDPDFLADAVDQLAEWVVEHPSWLPEPPERPFARFQISVTLIDEWSIP
jgi:hypothetical protein